MTEKNTLDYLPKILLYNATTTKSGDTLYQVNSIYLVNEMILPIKNIMMKAVQFKKYGLSYEFQPIEQMIDREIEQYDKTKEIVYDKRFLNVKNRIYRNESYNLFRLELSIYLIILVLKTLLLILYEIKILIKKIKRRNYYNILSI